MIFSQTLEGYGMFQAKIPWRAPGGSQDWLLLYAGGHVTIPFKGRACDLAEGWAMAQLPAANLRHTYGKYA